MRPLNKNEKYLALAAALTLSLCAVLISSARYEDARTRHRDAIALRAAHASDVSRLRALLSRDAVIDDRPRAEQDLLARLNAVLVNTGVDKDAITDIRIEEPRSLQGAGGSGGAEHSSQQAEAVLTAVSPSSIAEFLAAWSNQEPLWAITSVRLDHTGTGRRARASTALDERYRAVIRFENIFLSAATTNGAS